MNLLRCLQRNSLRVKQKKKIRTPSSNTTIEMVLFLLLLLLNWIGLFSESLWWEEEYRGTVGFLIQAKQIKIQ